MARIRTIKPEFFLHEGLAELSASARLLFIGLWTLADKDGRLEDRPRRIKASVFPYEDIDVVPLLVGLEGQGHIVRYAVGSELFIVIPNWSKHQRPHPKEAISTIPPPPSREKKRQEIKLEPSIPSTPGGREGKESLDNGKESREGKESEGPNDDSKPEDLQELWNRFADASLPRWKGMTEKRLKQTKARLDERPIAEWPEVIERINKSAFCLGENDRGWRASPDWILQPDAALKVLEGKYDGGKPKPSVEPTCRPLEQTWEEP